MSGRTFHHFLITLTGELDTPKRSLYQTSDMITRAFLLLATLAITCSSCVSKKKYLEAVLAKDLAEIELKNAKRGLDDCTISLNAARTQVETLTTDLEHWKSHSTTLLERMSQLAVLSQSESENVRKSLEKIDEQDQYIKKLVTIGQKKDSINVVLLTNLKQSLGGFSDTDIQISVKKGVIYVSISDRLLFKTGSAAVSRDAKSVLSKLAQVINSQPNIEVMVEGHTDTIPIHNAQFADNWALSVARASSIVRILASDYKVLPARMVASGRGEFSPKASNATEYGRSLNRRTEIILVPRIDEFFELLTPDERP